MVYKKYNKLYKGTGTGIAKLAIRGGSRALPSIVYYIRLRFTDGLVLYKIGYTSMSLRARLYGYYTKESGRRYRKGGMGIPAGTIVECVAILYQGDTEDAFRHEQDLHRRYAEHRYSGPNRIANGNSELYRRDVLGLDNVNR